jgi:hypothetical protein
MFRKSLAVLAMGILISTSALADGEFGGFPGSFNGSHFNGPVNVNNATGNNPTVPNATSAANATGGTGGLGGQGFGGLGGAATVGSVAGGSASNSMSVQGDANKAYALGMSSLTSSANACQGSFSFAFLAASYTVRFCELMQKAIVMGGAKFDTRSIQNVMCLDPDIAQSASECAAVKSLP